MFVHLRCFSSYYQSNEVGFLLVLLLLLQSALESRVKAEQQQVEGADGVLAAMKEQAHSMGK